MLIIYSLIQNGVCIPFNVSKCCDEGQVFDELTSKCSPGTLEIEHLKFLADARADEFIYVVGSLQPEDCDNGSQRFVLQKKATRSRVFEHFTLATQ